MSAGGVLRRTWLLALVAVLALILASCGDDDEGAGDTPRLTVSAAASLTDAFEQYGGQIDYARARFSFAGSDELAAQIRRGAKPDVYAAANTKLPDALYDEKRVERPVVFAGNRLVIAVPADADRVGSVEDLTGPDVSVVAGAPAVPVGSYMREVLSRLRPATEKAILANVRSSEPDVKGVVAKLIQGAADAGFVYVTDVEATNGKLKAIELPERLRPSVAYGVAIVRGAKEPEAAQDFIDGLLDGAGRDSLRQAGFEPPPR